MYSAVEVDRKDEADQGKIFEEYSNLAYLGYLKTNKLSQSVLEAVVRGGKRWREMHSKMREQYMQRCEAERKPGLYRKLQVVYSYQSRVSK